MEDLVEPEWSKLIEDESPPRAANECTPGVCSETPDCTIDSLFMKTPYEGLDELELYLDLYDSSFTQLSGSDPSMSTPLTEIVMSSTSILEPLMAQTKGRAKDDHKKGGQWKGGMEIAMEKRKMTCKGCRVFGSHDKRTCPQLKLLFQKAKIGVATNDGRKAQSDDHGVGSY
ncbi:hypothetical protein GIB67_022800 [Kingdonia uniflora]|uniref:Uncharacterized protein n=1 Tax=Kingdonia uniflora TaxID=39325 RepID=A0A7J7P6Q4_9MAGN|nr:hypothetical protein GIB67_022800 [Kingdonia uniflora]